MITSDVNQKKVLVDAICYLVNCQQPLSWLTCHLYKDSTLKCLDLASCHSSKEGADLSESCLGVESVRDPSGQDELAEACCSLVDFESVIEENRARNELSVINEAVAEKLILILQSRLKSFCHSLLKLSSSSSKL